MLWSVALGVVLVRMFRHDVSAEFVTEDWWLELLFVPVVIVGWLLQSRDAMVWGPELSEGEFGARMERMGYMVDTADGPHVWFRPKRFFGLVPGTDLQVVITSAGYVVIGQRWDLIRFRNVAKGHGWA